MEAAPQEVLLEGEGTCFRVSAYPLGCGTKYVMDKILTSAVVKHSSNPLFLNIS